MPSQRRFFVPEVVQTSTMDCGPATLKCLLEGFGIPVSYGRLREACQTDVDGTSIDTIEDIARQLGLVAEQMMMPIDHLFLATLSNLPALVLVRLPAGYLHFMVVWRTHGSFVQIMDPAAGRRWLSQTRLLQELYQHDLPIAAATWRNWAISAGLQTPLQLRLAAVGVKDEISTRLQEEAIQDESWFAVARLDAATRLVAALVAAKGLQPGAAATALLEKLIQQSSLSPTAASPEEPLDAVTRYTLAKQVIPEMFWSVQPLQAAAPWPEAGADSGEMLLLHGIVLVRVSGRRELHSVQLTSAPTGTAAVDSPTAGEMVVAQAEQLPPDLVAALHEAPAHPEWEVWRNLRADGLFTPALLLFTALLATLGVLIEAALLRGLLNTSALAQLLQQPWTVWAFYLLFVVLLATLELPLNSNIVQVGRRLETRLRIAFFEKLPKLDDRYFHSRLLADMALRAYGLRQLHDLPELVLRIYRTGWQLLLTALGIIWLAPVCTIWALLAVAWSVGCSLLAQWFLAEQNERISTHAGALSRFYLDGLLGLIPVRTHAAERALRREHEKVLVSWGKASDSFYRNDVRLQALAAIGSYACTFAIIFTYLTQGGATSGVLLLLYWALNLASLGQTFVTMLRQYPAQRNRILRMLEPLRAPEAQSGPETAQQASRETVEKNTALPDPARAANSVTVAQPLDPPIAPVVASAANGVTIRMADVTVLAGGHTILQNINVTIKANEHVAIVGASGAGKSSLVGLLLGWLRPLQGTIWIDDTPFTGEVLATLRQQTAWVDPAVQLWNRSLWENLHYGVRARTSMGDDHPAVADVLLQADLYQVLERLPHGLQTTLGEGGGLVSGGEGQRVRLGRAMMHANTRLVILDEPFRGLDRGKRRQQLQNARTHWHNATLLCITHDVSETLQFDRVLVIADGQIVEDGSPQQLTANPESRYLRLLQAEEIVRTTMWQGAQWRNLSMADGNLQEIPA